jgi:predicted MFS family arabinose efflux permease
VLRVSIAERKPGNALNASLSAATSPRVDLASPTLLAAAMLIHLAGPSVFVLQPMVVQGLVDQMGFTAAQANFTMFVEGAGKALASIALIGLVGRFNWRRLLVVALATMIVGNLASIVVRDREAFVVLRALTGAAAGFIVPLSYATVGLTPRADRNFGLMWVVLFLYAGSAFLVIPELVKAYGVNAMFAFFAGLAACGLALVRFMPVSGESQAEGAAAAGAEVSWPRTVLAIASVFLFSAGLFAFWANASLLGKAAGVSEQEVNHALSASQFVSIAGALVTTIVAVRFGRMLPLATGFALLAISMALVIGQPDARLYFVAICLFNFAWNMVDPYMLGTLASLGRAGRVVVCGTALRMVGVSVGPGLAGQFLAAGQGYDAVVVLSLAALAASFAALLPPLLAQRSAIARSRR